MSGRRFFGIVCVVVAVLNAILALYAGKPWFAALWTLILIVALIRTVGDWNKPPGDVSTHPLRTQLTYGAVLLAGAALWWFSRGPA